MRRPTTTNPFWLHTPEVHAKISKANTGRKLTLEHREKLRSAKLKSWADPTYRKRLSDAHKGYVPSPEARAKLSEAQKGEKHWNWQGGTPVEINRSYTNHRWKVLRRSIVERDGFACSDCRVPRQSRKLHVHHIEAYKRTRNNDPSNLITLCIPCHRRRHKGDKAKYDAANKTLR